jgi:hypothetical protein
VICGDAARREQLKVTGVDPMRCISPRPKLLQFDGGEDQPSSRSELTRRLADRAARGPHREAALQLRVDAFFGVAAHFDRISRDVDSLSRIASRDAPSRALCR